MKNIFVFDLDGTIIDSSHRTPTHPDGTLNLIAYLGKQIREHIFNDTLFPLVNTMRKLYNTGQYVIICTARIMSKDDIEFLTYYNIPYNLLLSRNNNEDGIKDAILKSRKLKRLQNLKQFSNKHWIMFDDAHSVISSMRQIGIACLNAKKVNERLQK